MKGCLPQSDFIFCRCVSGKKLNINVKIPQRKGIPMKRYIERVWELMNDEKSKHYVPLYDEANPKGISFEQLRDLSGCVYAYLKARNIGKEDFVMIQLPRGLQPAIAVIGVWRAGAALVIAEEIMTQERIDYIYKDCGCKMVITSEIWEEILRCEPLDGYEETDPHDAALAVYTSGTTGNPKGVLHEYGTLEQCVQSANYQGEELASPGDRFALAAPLNYMAPFSTLVYCLHSGYFACYILSFSTVKNPIALMKFLLIKRITAFFLTPSHARKLAGKTGPFLKKIAVGTEPANHFHLKGLKNYNVYGQSESGFFVTIFVIDKEYDVCPVGKPQLDVKYRVVGDDGNDVAVGEIGEFVIESRYTRGYINLPEETAKVFRDGFYHTSDLVYIRHDGNIVVCGRKDAMIKVNGNRIEPAEIESAIRANLKIDWCVVKGFVDDDHTAICAYYKDDITFDADLLREQLQKRLPYYMIPTHFIKLDSVPLKPNGKLEWTALPKPDTKNILRPYKEPTTEIEAALCNAMQKVLKMERIGIDDDFYEMGGDSLRSMELLLESGLPGLDVGGIFRGRTAAKIAQLYMEQVQNRASGSDEALNEAAKLEEHKLTTEQLYMFAYQNYTPDSTMYNVFAMLRFEKDEVDLKHMAKAIELAIRNHPAICTTLRYNNDGTLVQQYDAQMPVAVTPEKISAAEFEKIKDTLVQPFTILNSPLFRYRLFETQDAAYLFFDVHHILCDGTSLKIFMNSVLNAYIGAPMEKDHYYLVLTRREQMEQTEFYKESRRYYEDTYENVEWTVCPKVDIQKPQENKMGNFCCDADVLPMQIAAFEKKYMISRNEFYIAATLLAIAVNTGKKDVQVSWIYNGREDEAAASSVGLLYRDLPVAVRLRDGMNLRDIINEIHKQVQNGIKYSCYPYLENDPKIVDGDVTCVLYQSDLYDVDTLEGFNVETVEIRQNKAAAQTVLDIQILDGKDGLKYKFDYAAGRYEEQTMIDFQNLFERTVSAMVRNVNAEVYTLDQLKKDVCGKKGLMQKIKDIFGEKKQP